MERPELEKKDSARSIRDLILVGKAALARMIIGYEVNEEEE